MTAESVTETGSKRGSISQVEKTIYPEGKNVPHLRFSLVGEPARDIPLLSVRDSSHHETIARIASSGQKVIFVAGGVVGALIAVERTDNDDPKAYEFWDIKPGRPDFAKVPMLLKHESQEAVIDWEKVHPGLKFLRDVEQRQKLSGEYPLHVIWPFNTQDVLTDRTVFVTTAEDTQNLPADMQVNNDTVCLFFHRDEDWLQVAQAGSKANERARWGVTSCNPHKRMPPFTLEEFKTEILDRAEQGAMVWETSASAIIDDPIANLVDVGSSHTQIRIQQEGEVDLDGEAVVPTIFVVRKGSLSTEGLRRLVEDQFPGRGIKVQELPSAKIASRKHPEDMSLDDRLERQAQLVREKHSK